MPVHPTLRGRGAQCRATGLTGDAVRPTIPFDALCGGLSGDDRLQADRIRDLLLDLPA
jgi:hypothetical protein